MIASQTVSSESTAPSSNGNAVPEKWMPSETQQVQATVQHKAAHSSSAGYLAKLPQPLAVLVEGIKVLPAKAGKLDSKHQATS
jgi:hypothetical protein